MLLAYDKLDTANMCSKDCQLQARRNYKDHLAQNQDINFEYWKIPVLSVAIAALINVDKSGPNHLKSLIFCERALSAYNGVVCAAGAYYSATIGCRRDVDAASYLSHGHGITGVRVFVAMGWQ